MAVGEHAWIARLIRRLARDAADRRVVVGPGDDAAVLRAGGHPLLVTTDALVEGVHFRRSWMTPLALGRRAYGVNASDIAAMGGRPTAAVVALTVPRGASRAFLDGLMAGFAGAARRHRVAVVGGNVTRGPRLSITVTLLGDAPGRVVTRAGARPGDGVWVTGRLGAMGAALKSLTRGRAARVPVVPDRVAAGLTLAPVATAMIDVSDGLVQDLGHVARASRVAIQLDTTAIPMSGACRAIGPTALETALTAGEDYELACTVPRRLEATVRRRLRRIGCPITRIGEVVAGRPRVVVLDAQGQPLRLGRAGFDHLD